MDIAEDFPYRPVIIVKETWLAHHLPAIAGTFASQRQTTPIEASSPAMAEIAGLTMTWLLIEPGQPWLKSKTTWP